MKPKSHCPRCARYVCTKKLKKSLLENIMVCPNCYFSENCRRNTLTQSPEINLGDNCTQHRKTFVRMAKLGKITNRFSRDEVEFLKNKHKSDSFITGKKEVGEIKRLKEGLVKVKMPTPKAKPSSKLDKKKFLEGLK